MPDEKSCTECQHRRRERTGPYEWLLRCGLHQIDFPNAADCGAYLPGDDPTEDEGEHWPLRCGWEVTK